MYAFSSRLVRRVVAAALVGLPSWLARPGGAWDRAGMRRLSIVGALIGSLAACQEPPRAVPPKPPNTELILGEYERHPPDGTTAIRFRADGSVRLAKTKALLDSEPALAVGTWKVEGTKLTLTYEQGACAEAAGDKTGVYNVVVSKIGVHFTKVEDSCERRAAIDGQTWWRLK
jgi:hypothetical protein